ncbi:MAG: DUF72 domain-containing protein [Saprospiraceae bacterium]|nr:DUF72 domain-containing protein [Saprospiraceae bacterium]
MISIAIREGIHIGTSGWNYDHWKGPFYDETISGDEMLRAYANRFRTVEVNGTFYSLPEPDTVKEWCDTVPEEFTFSVKASRYITHMKKLKDPNEPLANLFEIIEPFGEQVGPVLFQLPPNWNVDTDRLENFLEALPTGYRYTFEFRDRSWHCEEVYELLNEHEAALCFYDLENYRSPEKHTAGFVYLRLHGPNEEAYTGSYPEKELKKFAGKFTGWRDEGRPVYCYFDNDQEGYAPNDALRLIEIMKDME